MKILRLALIALSLASVLRAEAPTAADKIAAGRAALATHDLVTAQARLQEALAIEPGNQTAAALLGFSQWFGVVGQASSQAILDRAAVTADGRDVYQWSARALRDAQGNPALPADSNLRELGDYWRETLVPASELARGNLALVNDENFQLTLSAAEVGAPVGITLDYGDVLMARAFLRASEFLGHFVNGQNLDGDRAAINLLAGGDLLVLSKVLDANPDLFTAGSATERAAARSAMLETMQLYRQASAFVRARPANVDRLFMLEAEQLAQETDFRALLDRIERSLTEYAPMTDDVSVDKYIKLAPLFSTNWSIRAQLPPFNDGGFNPFAMPDATLGGLLAGYTRENLADRLAQMIPVAPALPWQWNHPQPQGNMLSRYAYLGGGRHLVVGAAGTVGLSEDGRTWTYRTIPDAGYLNSIAIGAGKIVVMSRSNAFVSSDGGLTWRHTLRNFVDNYYVLTSVVYAGGQFIAMGASYCGRSSDGENWTYEGISVNNGYDVQLNEVIYTGTQLVAVGVDASNHGLIFTSPEGRTWKLRYTSTIGALCGVASGGGRLVAVGAGNQRVVSTDGITWSAGNILPGANTPYFWGASYRNGLFLAVGKAGVMATSADGVAWSGGATTETDELRDAGAGPDGFYITGANGILLRSPDGATTTRTQGSRSGPTQPNIRSLLAVDDRLYAVGFAGTIAYSLNGTDYTSVTSGTTRDLWCLIRQGGLLYAVGDGGTILASADGTTWSARTSGTVQNLRTISYLNNQFVATGDNGTLLTSPDGISWTARTTGITGAVNGVAYGNGRYLAAGGTSNGSFQTATSADGITWTPYTTYGSPLRSVIFFKGQFILLPDLYGYATLTSDGVNWSSAQIYRGQNTSQHNLSLRVIDGRCYALVSSAALSADAPVCHVAVSDDGFKWMATDQPTDIAQYAIERFNGRLYTAGDSGSRLETSPVAPFAAPVVVTGLGDRAARTGDDISFCVAADTSRATTYAWRKDGVLLPAATMALLSLTNVQPADAGTYTVTVSNPTGSTVSSAVLTVDARAVAPFIVTPPAAQAILRGAPAGFAVVAKGQTPFTYQWRKDGVDIPGATAAGLTLGSGQPTDAGAYSVAVTNAAGTVVSASAALAVYTNDNFADRTILTGAESSATGSNIGATWESGEPGYTGYSEGPSVWWSWTAPASGPVALDLAGSALSHQGTAAIASVDIFTGGALSALTRVPLTTTVTSPNQAVRFSVVAGQTYQIAVAGAYYAAGAGPIALHLAMLSPPVNDNFANRLPLVGSNLTATGSAVGATPETDEPANVPAASTWWTWTAPVSGTYTINLDATDFGPVLSEVAVYTGSTLPTLALVGRGSGYPGSVKFTATAGTTYQIAVGGSGWGGSGVIRLSLSSVAVPPNDNFATRTVLTGTTITTTGTTLNATKESGEPLHAANYGSASIWWTWTAPDNGSAAINLTDQGDLTTYRLIGVYTGTSVSALTPVASKASYAGNPLVFPVTAGTVYQIAVDYSYGVPGPFGFSLQFAPTPANDLFANRAVLTGANVMAAGTNLGATRENGEPNHAGTAGTGSLWWTWTAPGSGPVVVEAASDFDTLLGVYTGGTLAGLTPVAQDDDSGGNGSSRLIFQAIAGTSYQIALDVRGTTVGSFSLKLAQGAPIMAGDVQSAGLAVGATTTLDAVVTGSGPFTYQWQKDGVDISGATGPTLTLSDVRPEDTGAYSVIVTNALGSAVSNRGLISVEQGVASLAWAAPAAISYGTPLGAAQLNATANMPGTFTYMPQQGAILQAGLSRVLTATFTPSDTVNYQPSSITQVITVSPVALTARPDDKSRAYGGADPVFTITYTGFVNNDTAAAITAPTTSTTATPASAVGTYPITLTGGTAANYTLTSVNGTLTVTPAPLTVTAVNQTRPFGVRNPPLTLAYTGFVNNDTAASLVYAPTASTTAELSSPPGVYPITVRNGLPHNYALTYVDGTLTVTPPDYHGTYFGTFASGGQWALYVRADNTATYIAYLPSRQSAIVTNLTLTPYGTFTVTGWEIIPFAETTARALALSGAETPVVRQAAAIANNFGLSGQISATGTIAAALSVDSGAFYEQITGAADTGAAQTPALYTAQALGTVGGVTYAIVGASGQALVVTTGAASVDSATGIVDGAGQFSATTSNHAALSFTLDTSAQTIDAKLTPAGSTVPISYVGLPDTITPVARVVNLSVRSTAGIGDQTLIVGFVINGSGNKTLLARGVGPGIATQGVANAVADPQLRLLDKLGANVDANNDWGGGETLTTLFASLGAMTLAPNSKDAAVYHELSTGVYSFHVFPTGNNSGVALAELYDADADGTSAQVVNISARTQVGTGENILIAGFVITGNSPKKLLIRGLGPSIAGTVGGALADPQLYLFRSTAQGSVVVASNDNWAGNGEVRAAAVMVGTNGLISDTSKDAAMVVTLQPGVYSAQVSGVGGTTGVALVEVFLVP